MKAIKVDATELKEISIWFENRDYSELNNLTVGEFITEIEERLELYRYAQMCNGNIKDNRWWILEDSLLIKKCNSPRANFMDTQGISILKFQHLAMLLEAKEKLPKSSSMPPASYNAQDNQLNMLKDQYLAPSPRGEEKIILSVDITSQSDEELMKQFAHQLETARNAFKIDNPSKKIKTNKFGFFGRFVKFKSIQYLDLLIYCLIKPNAPSKNKPFSRTNPPRETPIIWQLSDQSIATLFDPYELDAEHIKEWRKEFYAKKLLNSEYINKYFEEIKSNPTDLLEKMPR
ncbi:MAG: DUF6387 family protein [Colwellia sp.]